MGDVQSFGGKTILPIPVERVLAGALDAHSRKPFRRVLVIAVFEDGEEYFACSESDGGIMLWDMERCRHDLMKNADSRQARGD